MIPANYPHDWFWIVAGDDSRFYSSAARGYVEELPGGAGVTRIASEEELWDVLRQQAPDCLPEGIEKPVSETERLRADLDAAKAEIAALKDGLIRKAVVTADDLKPRPWR